MISKNNIGGFQMAENFRKAKIQKYYDSLKIHENAVKEKVAAGSITNEVTQAHYEGFLMALDMVTKALKHEFDLDKEE